MCFAFDNSMNRRGNAMKDILTPYSFSRYAWYSINK